MMNRRHFLSASFQSAAAVGLAPQASAQSNETIEKARQAAMDALKPTRAQIEHGLELHANSIVTESYGFSPRCAIDGDALRAAIEAGASK
jgi:membrane dipeptidase